MKLARTPSFRTRSNYALNLVVDNNGPFRGSKVFLEVLLVFLSSVPSLIEEDTADGRRGRSADGDELNR